MCTAPTVEQVARASDGCGCRFVFDPGDRACDGRRVCGAARRPGSAYCEAHHALCHLPSGSRAERRQLREIAALAAAVGGRQGRAVAAPPGALLRRLKKIERAFARPYRS